MNKLLSPSALPYMPHFLQHAQLSYACRLLTTCVQASQDKPCSVCQSWKGKVVGEEEEKVFLYPWAKEGNSSEGGENLSCDFKKAL